MTEITSRLSTALADRYKIERRLGEGGMATVYLAHDLKHDRKVAVKVLRPELSAILGSERFLNEIKVTANLQHPHILQLFDSGEADSFLYYVMPLVQGDSLRTRLNREKQLSVVDCIRITEAVADALSYAHRRNVVHRDIKPENILLQEGFALIADFGIALAITSAGGERITETGLSLGTPAYMSPEQVSGDREIDGRSDLYSLACVTYEMLGGDPPFMGSSAQAIMARHLTDPPPPITTVRPDVRPAVAEALRKALSKVPADRFDEVTDFAAALSELIETAQDKKSIAVLPFSNLSADPDSEYFSDGMSEEIINALGQLSGLHVASRTSSFYFKGKAAPIAEVGETLSVATVLEGSVRKVGNRVRITVQLIDVGRDEHLWSQRYDREMDDIFAVQDEISRSVATALRLEFLGGAKAPIVERGTSNLDAYDAYLLGRFHWNKRTATDLQFAASHFEHAVEADGGFALAWSGLADAYMLYHPSQYDVQVISWEEALDRAERAAHRAIEIDETIAEAWTALAAVTERRHDYPAAEAAYKRAIALNPQYATAHQWYGGLLMTTERTEEAYQAFERARKLDPLSMIIGAEVVPALDVLGRIEEATSQLEEVARRHPDALIVHQWGAYHYLTIGDFGAAAPYVGRAVATTTEEFGTPREIANRIRDAGSRAETLTDIAHSLGRPEGSITVLRSVVGDEAALAWLEDHLEGRDALRFYLPTLVAYLGSELRTSTRGQAALKKLRGGY